MSCRFKGTAYTAIERLASGLQFCAVDRQTIATALRLKLNDFEDGIQLSCAIIYRLDAIVTRDSKDFISNNIPIYSPTELLNHLSQRESDL